MNHTVRNHDDHQPRPPASGGRPLHPVPDEPPYDYPPHDPYLEQRSTRAADNHAIADRDAEQALLAVLLREPDQAEHLTTQIDTSDLYWPEHQLIWDTFHDLHQVDHVPPDSVLLLGRLQRINTPAGRNALRLLPQLVTNPATGLLADSYARTIRDHSRLRDVDAVATQLRQLVTQATPDDIETTLGEALQRIDETVMRFGPTTRAAGTGLADLSWLPTGEAPTPPAPAYATRTDGHALFYPAKVNGIFGDPEAAKTWLAMTAVIEALAAGQTAAIIDVDHNGPDHTVARLLLMGAHPLTLADPTRFRYYEPHEPDELLAAVDDVTRLAFNVLVLDSIGEVFPMLGVSTNDGDEMTTALRRTCTRPASAGCCVITIDHLPKSTEARQTGYAIGSIAKKRMIRGSYIRAEARTQPAPGQIGRITLKIEKDSTGGLRKHTPGGFAGTFVIDSTHSETEGITRWRIEREIAPIDQTTGGFRPTALMERVSRHIEDNDLCSGRDIEDAVSGRKEYVRAALKLLIAEGFVTTMHGTGRRSKALLHHSVALYREAEDDHIEHDA